jgi:hypothetical protein
MGRAFYEGLAADFERRYVEHVAKLLDVSLPQELDIGVTFFIPRQGYGSRGIWFYTLA